MIRRVVRFAWLSSVRQPARTALGVLGVVAIGALLFDMLLLSQGLVLSFRDLLDRAGFDVRVLATDARPFAGPSIEHADEVARRIEALPEVEAVLQVRIRRAEIAIPVRNSPNDHDTIEFIGTDPPGRSVWTILEGSDLPGESGGGAPLVVNRNLARQQGLSVGSMLRLRGACRAGSEALPPVTFTIAGIAEFPFDDAGATTVAGHLKELRRLCGGEVDGGRDMLMVRSRQDRGPVAAAAAIRRTGAGLHVVTNQDLLERFSRVEFSYFRQISFVLATVTLFFGFLLIAVLLTASVNQRLGEIAALRAVGLSRARVVAGVLCESVLMVAAGGVLAVPVGLALSIWLDHILRELPGIPVSVHFFVFEPRVLFSYGVLVATAALGAAFYPMWIIGTLPIAATLRREVVS
jgi:ABC-type lipoprotein release transport system permease subunit